MANKFLTDIELDAGLVDNNDVNGDAGDVLSSTGTGVEWIPQSSVVATSDFMFYYVKNSTGVTISKGKGVMAVGTDGNSGHILVDEMVADGTVEARYFLGLMEEDIANGEIKRAISFGELDQFNTTGQNGETWTGGDVLWCDPDSAGDFTITEPDGPNVKIPAAFVLKASTQGKIQIRVQANEGIHQLHDTNIGTQADGEFLVWNNTTGVWFNDDTIISDYTNGRIGIGTASPSTKLDVSGVITATGGNSTEWNTAYDNSIVSAVVTGTTTKTLTLTQQDAGTITASWTDYTSGVTSVATTAPITGGTITSTGTIGITQATTSTDGYLSSTDWNTFNNKTSNTGTVTSVGVSAGSGISVTGSPITTSGTITVTNSDRGSSQAIFKNFAVSGQTTVVADSNNDTLTLVAGSNVTITTNATTDTITINSSDQYTGTVTSVGTGNSTFISGSGGPITTTGSLTYSLSATGTPSSSTYLRGDNTWATLPADNNTYVTSASFNTGNGVLTLTRNDAGTVTTDLDGRYLLDTTDTLTGILTVTSDINGQGWVYAGESKSSATYAFAIGNTEIASAPLDVNGNATQIDYGDYNALDIPVYIRQNDNPVITLSATSGVGIYDTSPSYSLDVNGTFRATGVSYLNSGARIPGGQNLVFEDYDNDLFHIANWTSGGGDGLHIGRGATASGTPDLFVSDSSRVGIRTDSPATTLDVNGNIKMTETAATIDTDKFVVSDSGVLKYRTGSQVLSDIGAQASSNAVTTNTSQTISGSKTISAGTLTFNYPSGIGNNQILFQTNGVSNSRIYTDYTYDLKLQTYSTNGDIELGTTTSTKVYIDNGLSRVGINDTTPSYTLDVNGTFRATSTAYFNSTTFLSGSTYLGPNTYVGSGEKIWFEGDYDNMYIEASGTSYGQLMVKDSGGNRFAMFDGDSQGFSLGNITPSYNLHLQYNSAAKPTSIYWTTTSDERVKTNIRPYEKGLAEVIQLQPKLYDYNGKAGFDASVVDNIGIIAQETIGIFPEAINTYQAKLEETDAEKTELYNVDFQAITFAMINAIKELNEKVQTLEQEINTLKNG